MNSKFTLDFLKLTLNLLNKIEDQYQYFILTFNFVKVGIEILNLNLRKTAILTDLIQLVMAFSASLTASEALNTPKILISVKTAAASSGVTSSSRMNMPSTRTLTFSLR